LFLLSASSLFSLSLDRAAATAWKAAPLPELKAVATVPPTGGAAGAAGYIYARGRSVSSSSNPLRQTMHSSSWSAARTARSSPRSRSVPHGAPLSPDAAEPPCAARVRTPAPRIHRFHDKPHHDPELGAHPLRGQWRPRRGRTGTPIAS